MSLVTHWLVRDSMGEGYIMTSLRRGAQRKEHENKTTLIGSDDMHSTIHYNTLNYEQKASMGQNENAN